jgi:hypothetical protein
MVGTVKMHKEINVIMWNSFKEKEAPCAFAKFHSLGT